MSEKILITAAQIDQGLDRLSQHVVEYFQSPENVLAVAIMEGGARLREDLLQRLAYAHDWDIPKTHIKVTSYPNGEGSKTKPVISEFNNVPPHKNILLIDDLMDSGVTLQEVIALLHNHGSLAVAVVVLLNKIDCNQLTVNAPMFSGFELKGDPWVWGYGIDKDGEHGRNVPHIMVKE